MKVHVVDGTYELFRQFFARPPHANADGKEVAAARAVVRGMVSMLEDGVTHIGVATDQVIESFRNDMFDGYKSGEGIDPVLWAQFGLLEEGLRAVGIATFGMVEFEADDAMASIAAVAAADSRVEKVLICTPDKDLAQCVVGDRVVQFDRRQEKMYNAEGVMEKFGVKPESIPDYLGLVGDAADGIPGLPGWGAKSTSTVLAHYTKLENIPAAAGQWEITVRSGAKLAQTLADNTEAATLYRELAILRADAPTIESVDELRWSGPTADLDRLVKLLDAPDLINRTNKLAKAR